MVLEMEQLDSPRHKAQHCCVYRYSIISVTNGVDLKVTSGVTFKQNGVDIICVVYVMSIASVQPNTKLIDFNESYYEV